MSDSNKIKIQNILSDLFYKHRYIFWYDADGAMEDFVSTTSIDGIEVLILDYHPESSTECYVVTHTPNVAISPIARVRN